MLHVRICAGGALGNRRPYRDTCPVCTTYRDLDGHQGRLLVRGNCRKISSALPSA
jgi:hypothetical protein